MYTCVVCLFFFFKQKTAYEMRISDWSSDVCPSDLNKLAARGVAREDAEAAVELMAAEGWQDDARFAKSLARMRAGSGYGPIRIRAELGTHGLDEVVIVQAFAALAEAGEDDWRRQARNLVRRRFGDDFTRDLALRRIGRAHV